MHCTSRKPDNNKQATAQIALAELPEGQWKEVIQGLATPVIQNNPNVFLKESSLEALGYICEEIV